MKDVALDRGERHIREADARGGGSRVVNNVPGDGAVVGLGASGAIKTLSAFGNKTTPAPSSIVSKDNGKG